MGESSKEGEKDDGVGGFGVGFVSVPPAPLKKGGNGLGGGSGGGGEGCVRNTSVDGPDGGGDGEADVVFSGLGANGRFSGG